MFHRKSHGDFESRPNYTERLADCNLMKLEDVFDFQRLVFGFKLLNGFLPFLLAH